MQGHDRSILATKGGVSPIDKHTLMLLDFEKSMNDIVTGKGPIGDDRSMEMTRKLSTVEFYGVDFSRLSNCTVECWVSVTNNDYWMLMQGDTNAKYIMASRPTSSVYSNGSGSNIKTYINGKTGAILKRDGSWNHCVSTGVDMSKWNRIRMGEYTNYETFGSLFGLKIWDRELSREEVIASKNGSLEVEPLHYWKMSDTKHGIVTDSIGGADGYAINTSIGEGMTVYTKECPGGDGAERKHAISVDASSSNIVPEESTKFTSGWSDYSGANIIRQQGVHVPEWDTYDATRITSTGGDFTIKSHIQFITQDNIEDKQVFSGQVRLKNIGENPVRVHSNRTATYLSQSTFEPGEIGICRWVTVSNPKGSGGNVQIQFRSVAGDDLDFIAFEPQIEERDFRTSYTPSERPEGQLAYPNPVMKNDTVTLSCWAYFRGPNLLQERMIVFTDEENSASPLFLSRRTGNVDVYGKSTTGGYSYRLTGPKVENDTWHHIAVTIEETVLKLYVNGEHSGTGAIDVGDIYKCGTVNIGSEHYLFDGYRPLNGLIDEVRIDSTARSEDEIQAWYHQGRNRGGYHT